MKTTQFKTDITCSGCLSKVAPHLDKTAGKGNWDLDLQDPEKILTVLGEEDVNTVKKAVKDAGYTAKEIGR